MQPVRINQVNKILEMLNDGAWHLMGELESESQFPPNAFNNVIDFLQQYKFVEVKNKQVRITESGQELLELPEEETLYTTDKLKAADDEIKAMAERMGVTKKDVIFAVWIYSKDLIAAKLRRDLKSKKEAEQRTQ